MRDEPGIDKEDLEILTRGVKNLHHAGIAKQLVKRFQRKLFGQRVDQHRIVLRLARHSELNQAKLGVIGPLAQKFGVDGDVRVIGGAAAILGQRLGRGYGFHSGPCFVQFTPV